MALFFTSSVTGANQGVVQMLGPGPASDPGSIRIQLWPGFVSFKSLITNLTIQEQGSYQFLHTLGDNIYLYLFGDRIGQLGVSGLCFGASCSNPGVTAHGVNIVRNYYLNRKISTSQARTDVFLAPATILPCYMTGFRAQVADPAMNMFQFHLEMALIPPRI